MKFYVALLLLFFSNITFASEFKNLNVLQEQIGFTKYYSEKSQCRRLRVAVLDKDFTGYKAEVGITLPANTIYISGAPSKPMPKGTGIEDPDDDNSNNNDNNNKQSKGHGTAMAQILTAFLTNELQATQWTPELVLYNAQGFSNIKYAIDDMINRKIDVVLYSEVWQYGGNNDGTGFINAEVNRATAAGITWVNAAGNFEQTTYNGAIETVKDDWVKLPDPNNGLMIRCEENKNGKCFLRAVLAWNDFRNNPDKGTDKDLDLVLTDDVLNILMVAGLRQSDDPKESRSGFSK